MLKAVACRARAPGFNPSSFQVSFSPMVAVKKLKTADLKSFTVGTLRNNSNLNSGALGDIRLKKDSLGLKRCFFNLAFCSFFRSGSNHLLRRLARRSHQRQQN